MTKQSKRNEERFFLDQFLTKTNRWEFVAAGEPPAPDFLVKDARGLLGVELTSIQKDAAPGQSSAMRAAERSRERFLARAAEHYYDHGGSPIRVLATKLPSAGLDIPDLTRRLKEACALALASSPQEYELVITHNDLADELPIAEFWIRTMGMLRHPTDSQWVAVKNSVGFVRTLSAEDLSNLVLGKAAKLAGYKTRVARVALLIYSHRTYSSGMIQVPPETRLSDGYGFEEVHLVLPPEQVLQLA